MKTNFKSPINLDISCVHCKKSYEVTVEEQDLNDYRNGKLIQLAFPYLTPGEREMMMTGICDKCFNEIMGPEE